MNDRDRALRVKKDLRNSWQPFFSRFGKLIPIQIEAIPAILKGFNVVVASPTASGKTEAVVAPLAERCLTERWDGLSVVYVVPTRALANDSLVRIAGPLHDMGISCALKHGDRPTLPRVLPSFLITTPESLDSMICRQPRLLENIRAVVLDEIHLLDNTYRGDQLRVLLGRLRGLNKLGGFSTHLLSATLSEPDEIAGRYVEDFRVVTVPGHRDIESNFFESQEEIMAWIRKHKMKKVLYFCNKRESVETTALQLQEMWRPYQVVAHHGSLSREERETAEEVMKEANVAACVATSTLEVGIDIGDIDLIVLVEPPWSVSALLQRVGRGNRRDDVTRAAALIQSDSELQQLKVMFDMTENGELPVEPYNPDYSVVIQQTISCLYSNPGGLRQEELSRIMACLASAEICSSIFLSLRENGWIEQRGGKLFATEELMDKGERGYIHSNIPDTSAYKVIDVATNKPVGTVAGVFDEIFILAHRVWEVVYISDDVIHAKRRKGAAPPALFRKHRNVGAYHYLLPEELR